MRMRVCVCVCGMRVYVCAVGVCVFFMCGEYVHMCMLVVFL